MDFYSSTNKQYSEDCTVDPLVESKNNIQLASMKMMNKAGNSMTPLQAYLAGQKNPSTRTMATSPLSFSYSKCNDSFSEDDQSLGDFTQLGNFNTVDFDIDIGEEIEEDYECSHAPNKYRNTTSTIKAVDLALQLTSFGYFEEADSSYQGLRCKNEDSVGEYNYDNEHVQQSNEHFQQVMGGSFPPIFGNDANSSIHTTGNESMISLSEAFQKLNSCMERTALSREMVKQLSENSCSSSASCSDLNRSSLSLSCHSRGARREMTSQDSAKSLSSLGNAPSKTGKSLLKPSYKLKSSLRKELRTKTSSSRVTGVRPVNWDIIL
eukprot:CAMPEP_0178880806 /NCGR_PEP_ID=MMETSP0747-20121128/12672_1 /TAXON_ID=913974 /ORGANISM="Nitzschia punctata, Strain CCMP561" /LENGTH=321 /DNA_ID=CAMNT_0020548749 /DNA_START=45 /DNA_END=1010 /DNA_ORIENTATION=-